MAGQNQFRPISILELADGTAVHAQAAQASPTDPKGHLFVSRHHSDIIISPLTSEQCPKPNLRFVHEHDKNDDFLPFLFMNTKEIAL